MVVDSSALVAIINNEPERLIFNLALAGVSVCLLSAASYVETSIIIDRRFGAAGAEAFEALLEAFQIAIEPVSFEQAKIARIAYREYGKGNHPAKLNLGDCFAYALARDKGQPLLFKGNDFSQTDIRCVF